MTPKPMYWRALIFGHWLIVHDRHAALFVIKELVQVRLVDEHTELAYR